MEKINKFKTVIRYIRDFSIVVAGIAVTLYVNDKVTNKSEKRNLTLYLHSVKLEMETNIKQIDGFVEALKPSVGYAKYLSAHDKKSLNKDSINSYNSISTSLQLFTYQANAFEMFKNSGIMRLMDNKDLLLTLWDVYHNLLFMKEISDWYFQTKWDDLKKELPLLLEDEDEKIIPMYTFYVTGTPIAIMNTCEKVLQKANDLVLTLEKELNE